MIHFERIPVISISTPVFLSSYHSLILTVSITINFIWSIIANKATTTDNNGIHPSTNVYNVNWVFATHPKNEVEWLTPLYRLRFIPSIQNQIQKKKSNTL